MKSSPLDGIKKTSVHATAPIMSKRKSQATSQISKSQLFYMKTSKHPSLAAHNQIYSYKNF